MQDINAVNQQQNKVKVYVRGYSKKACKLMINSTIKIEELKQIIEKKMKIPYENQLLFCKGKQIQNEQKAKLQNLSIVHVLNKQRIKSQEITIFIKKIGQVSEYFTYNVAPSMKIEYFQQRMLNNALQNIREWFLVYIGRRLNPKNTFQQELVEDQSQILLVQKPYLIQGIPFKLQARKMNKKNYNTIKQSAENQIIQNSDPEKDPNMLLTPNLHLQNKSSQVAKQKSMEVQYSSQNAQHSIPSQNTQQMNKIKMENISNQPQRDLQLKNKQTIQQQDYNNRNIEEVHRTYSQHDFDKQNLPIQHVSIHQNIQTLDQKVGQEHQLNNQIKPQPKYQYSVYDLLVGNQPQLKYDTQIFCRQNQNKKLMQKNYADEDIEIHSEVVEMESKDKNTHPSHNEPKLRKGQSSQQFIDIMKKRLIQVNQTSKKHNIQQVDFQQEPIVLKKGQSSQQFIDIMRKRLINNENSQQITQKQGPIIKKSQKSSQYIHIMNQRLLIHNKQKPILQINNNTNHQKPKKQIIKQYEDGQLITEFKVQKVRKPIRKINVFNPHQCQNNQLVKQQQARQSQHDRVSSANLQESEQTNDQLASTIKNKSNQFQRYGSSYFEDNEQSLTQPNQTEYTFTEANRNWSTQLDRQENIGFQKIKGGTDIESWQKVSLSFIEPDKNTAYNRILEDSNIQNNLDNTPTGFFHEQSSHDSSY